MVSSIRAIHRVVAGILGLLAGYAWHPSRVQAQTVDSLSLDAVLAQPIFPSYVPISLSPDGQWVAFTLQSGGRTVESNGRSYSTTGVPEQFVGCAVWIANVNTGETLRVIGGDSVTGWAPQWSPDGRLLAFYADQGGMTRLWIWDGATRAAKAVSDVVIRAFAGVEGPRWMPDSRAVVTRTLPTGSSIGADQPDHPRGDSASLIPGATVIVYHTDARWRARPRLLPPTPIPAETGYEANLALIDVYTSAVTTLAQGYRPYDYWVSPDGRFVAFTSTAGMSDGGPGGPRFPFNLVVAPIRPSSVQSPYVLAASVPVSQIGMSVAWSPNGRYLAYAVEDTEAEEQYYIAGSPDWKLRTVTVLDSVHHALAHRSIAQSLRWDPSGRTIFVQNDHGLVRIDAETAVARLISRPPPGKVMLAILGPAVRSTVHLAGDEALVVVTRDDSSKMQGVARINTRTGSWTQLWEAERVIGSTNSLATDASIDGRRTVFLSEGTAEPPDIWWATSDWSTVRRVTTVAPSLSGQPYGSSRSIEWNAISGGRVHGALLLPANYSSGRRYPLVVYSYPMEARSNDVYRYGLTGARTENMQLFASRGYAVLTPDAPIRELDQMHSIAEVILPGVDRVIEMGIADSARVAAIGHSWGGYEVLALLVQTTRFKAAVMRGGIGDLPAMYGEMESTGNAPGQVLAESWLGATLWAGQSRYIENSPVFYLDRVRTPLLIVHGADDTTVPVSAADEVFVDLRRLGQEVDYARYAGENHVEAAWSLANQKDYLTRVLRWFDDHLHPGAADRGVSEDAKPGAVPDAPGEHRASGRALIGG
jgi:dipeptidyl aminopeptidase/acylaminoacyl peptidase